MTWHYQEKERPSMFDAKASLCDVPGGDCTRDVNLVDCPKCLRLFYLIPGVESLRDLADWWLSPTKEKMNAIELKNWLEERDASCSIMVKKNQVHCAIFPFGAKAGHEECAESPDLGEAIRLAQHLYDIRHQDFPCPECGSPVRWIRATKTAEFLVAPLRVLWRVAGIKINGLACCETDKRRYMEEKDARDAARQAEQSARGS